MRNLEKKFNDNQVKPDFLLNFTGCDMNKRNFQRTKLRGKTEPRQCVQTQTTKSTKTLKKEKAQPALFESMGSTKKNPQETNGFDPVSETKPTMDNFSMRYPYTSLRNSDETLVVEIKAADTENHKFECRYKTKWIAFLLWVSDQRKPDARVKVKDFLSESLSRNVKRSIETSMVEIKPVVTANFEFELGGGGEPKKLNDKWSLRTVKNLMHVSQSKTYWANQCLLLKISQLGPGQKNRTFSCRKK